MQKRNKFSGREIAFISDTHIGSRYAMWKNVELNSSFNIPATKKQSIIYEYFTDFCLKANSCDTVVLMGDICEGNNRKEFGRFLTAVELEYQIKMAEEILKPFVKGRNVIGVDGSGYHNGLDMSLDSLLINRLNGKFFGYLAKIEVEGTGVRAIFTHGFSSAVMYHSTSLEKDSLLLEHAILNYMNSENIHLYVRGHLHRYVRLDFRNRKMLQLPCWKSWGGWRKIANHYGNFQPDIGGVIVKVSSSGNIEIYPYLYPPVFFDDEIQII